MKKLQEVIFTKHPAFKEGSKLTLFDKEKTEDIPTFFFLVGENGSGKTSILNLIYASLGETKEGYLMHVEEAKDLKASISIFDGQKYDQMSIDIEDERIRSDFHPDKLKIVYSRVDVSFKNTKIKSATAITADENEEPREQSENISEIIPQLLVNMKAEDDAFVADYVRDHKKIPENFTRKLDRFTGAFERMFNGAKTFKTVRPKNNEFKIVFTDNKGNDVDLDTFSTGEKQIIYRVGHLLKDLKNLDAALILIDEPETSLHPKWQKKYIQFLTDVFNGLDIQFLIATHSPYVLQGMVEEKSVCYKIDRTGDGIGQKVGFYKNMIGKGPSIDLINYKVYDIVDELLHIELFTALEIRENGYTKLKNKLNSDSAIKKATPFISTVSYLGCNIGDRVIESLPISIRNKIHHAEEINRPEFDENLLRESIEIMLGILTK